MRGVAAEFPFLLGPQFLRKSVWLLFFSLACFLFPLSAPVRADEFRSEIESVYSRRHRAAELLYLYGMRYRRASDFVAVDSSGERLDIEEQEAKWSQFFARVLQAKWTGKVLKIERVDDLKAQCVVSDNLTVLLRDSLYSRQIKHSTLTVSVDLWERRDGVWEQTVSKIVEQYQRSSPVKNRGN